MTNLILKVFPLLLLLYACELLNEKPADEFSAWKLLKTHRVEKSDPLFSVFGSIRYQIFTEASPKAGSRYAMVVYPDGPDSDQSNRRVLVGLIEQQITSGKETWQVSATDGEGNSFSDERVKEACLSCHIRTDRGILLGNYE